MTECDKLTGRLRAICRGEAGLNLRKTNAYRQKWGLKPLAAVSGTVKTVTRTSKACGSCGGKKSVSNPSGRLNNWGVGSQLAREYKGRGYPHCPDCHALSVKMDVNGIEWCKSHVDELVEDILPRAKALVAGAMALVHWGLTVTGSEDSVLRLKLKWDVEEAIKRAERDKPVTPVKQSPPKQVPFDGPIVRHLIYHLYPNKHTDQWKWNLDQLLQRIEVFNGTKVLGLAIDKTTVPAQEVRDYLAGRGFEIIEVTNDAKRGELTTFSKMIERIKTTDPNAIIFYGHGKGTTCGPKGKTLSGGKLPDMRRWSEAMYRGCLDDIPRVEQALSDKVFAGGFRRKQSDKRWYFSGTFFWFRAASVFSRQWQLNAKQRWAVEFWPATITSFNENACLFSDNAKGLYDPKNLTAAIASMEPVAASPVIEVVSKTYTPGVTLITPTGDRPEAFALCERWMQRQTYSGPRQWIVVDDGSVPTKVSAGQEYHRRKPHRGEGHTLPKNLRLALPNVRHDKLLIIEDDDWYAPNYVEQMSQWLDAEPLVGAGFARYYWPRLARFREFPDHQHASLCRTGMRHEVFGDLERCLSGNQSIDLRLWGSTPGVRHDEQTLCVSLKGMPGRKSGGGDPHVGLPDPDLSQLRAWIGDDVEHYRSILPKTIDQHRAIDERIVVYTVVLGGHDKILPPLVVNPNVRYVAITDGPAPKPWEIIRPETSALSRPHESRRLKLLAHELFPDADWTIYLDGQLQLAVDPLTLLAECEAWGDGDLYLFRHQDRDCIYREAEEVVRINRDRQANVRPIIDRYRKVGVPEAAGLYLGGMLIRRRGKADAFNSAWWGEVSSATHRDQISLPVALASSGVRFVPLPAMWWTHFFLRHPHARRPMSRRLVRR